MEKSLILDVLVVAFLLFCASIGARAGLIRSLAGFLQLVIAGTGAFLAANFLSPVISLIFLFDSIQKKIISGSQALSTNVFSAISDGVNAMGAELSKAAETLSAISQKAGLPKFLANSFAEKLLSAVPSSGESLLDTAARVVSENLAYILVFLLTFVIILIVVGFLTNWFVGLIRFIVPRFLDRFFGFFFGILAGALWVIVAFRFSGTAFPALFSAGSLLAPETLSGSYIASYLTNPALLSFLPDFLKTPLLQGSE